jgi:hypothetical protein
MGIYRGVMSVLWPKVGLGGPLVRPAGQLGWSGGQVSWCTNFGHWIPRASTFLDTVAKWILKWHQHLADRPRRWGRLDPLWLSWAWALCHITPLCHILCDYDLFWTY